MVEGAIFRLTTLLGAVRNGAGWYDLNLNRVTRARIDQVACIARGRCYAACLDTSHQAINRSENSDFDVMDDESTACDVCINAHPVEGGIIMQTIAPGTLDQRTGTDVKEHYANWTIHLDNPSGATTE